MYNYPVYNQRWNVDSSKGHITTNADLCLDAGDGYYPGAPVKVWQCYDDYDVQMFRIKRPQGGDMIKSVAARHDGVGGWFGVVADFYRLLPLGAARGQQDRAARPPGGVLRRRPRPVVYRVY